MQIEHKPADGIRAPRDGLSADCPILLTEQLVLRTPRVEDIDAIAILANNPAIATMVSRMPHPYTAMDAVEFVRKSAIRENGNCVYAMTLADSGRFVGCCALQARPGSPSLELGYWVGEPFWGMGFATEAVHGLVDMAFRTRDITHIDARCRVTNPGSRRVLQKSGFQFQGSEMVPVLALGASVSMEWFRLDRKTWVSLISWSNKSVRPART